MVLRRWEDRVLVLDWLKTGWTALIGWLKTRPAVFKAMSKKRKWLTGGIAGATVVLLVVIILSGVWLVNRTANVNAYLRDHECALPPLGSIHDTGRDGGLRWRVLYPDEETPDVGPYRYSGGIPVPWVETIAMSSAVAELEFLHAKDVVFEYTKEGLDKSSNRVLYMVAECKAVRILARRDEETTNTLKEGDIITVAIAASTRFKYNLTPPIHFGDRAIFFILPTALENKATVVNTLGECCEYSVNAFSRRVNIPVANSLRGNAIADFTALDEYFKIYKINSNFAGKSMEVFGEAMQEQFDKTKFVDPNTQQFAITQRTGGK